MKVIPQWPDIYQARLEALARVEKLNAMLLASQSATQTLNEWCATLCGSETHSTQTKREIKARVIRGVNKPLSAAKRRRLEVGPDEPIAYRRVELMCGDQVLSEADNWYVAQRLSTEMNEALTSTDIPFGRLIRPLDPRRVTIGAILLWNPLSPTAQPRNDRPEASLPIPQALLKHDVILYRSNDKPISMVREVYKSELLGARQTSPMNHARNRQKEPEGAIGSWRTRRNEPDDVGIFG